jgi:hypothetical protein
MPDEVEALAQTPSPLNTPCTLTELRNWLAEVDALAPGGEAYAEVSISGDTIVVAKATSIA